MIKIENEMHVDPEESFNQAVMTEFNKSLKSMTEHLLNKGKKNIKEL